MSDYIILTCPACGGKLQITRDLDRFACGNCGNELIVKRGGGTISLAPVIEGLRKVKTGVDKTASELAIVRLKEELEILYREGNDYEAYIRMIISVCIMGSLLLCIFTYILTLSFPLSLFLGAIIPSTFGIVYFRQTRETYKQRSANKEALITKKMNELKYHQDIVSRKSNEV